MSPDELIKDLFSEKKLKTTPQRLAVYKALELLCHACAEEVIVQVHKTFPTVTVGTVYNVLECLAANKVISKVPTGDNRMYFDINPGEHHHLYSEKNHRIEDFEDAALSELIRDYMRSKKIKGFELREIRVQLVGDFI